MSRHASVGGAMLLLCVRHGGGACVLSRRALRLSDTRQGRSPRGLGSVVGECEGRVLSAPPARRAARYHEAHRRRRRRQNAPSQSHSQAPRSRPYVKPHKARLRRDCALVAASQLLPRHPPTYRSCPYRYGHSRSRNKGRPALDHRRYAPRSPRVAEPVPTASGPHPQSSRRAPSSGGPTPALRLRPHPFPLPPAGRADADPRAFRVSSSLDEAAVYDRQIRLWGLEAQQRCACTPTPARGPHAMRKLRARARASARARGRAPRLPNPNLVPAEARAAVRAPACVPRASSSTSNGRGRGRGGPASPGAREYT